ncbi:MAG: zinc ribbon domain-containing protein [Oscillospiraceae bacterium]
MYCNKCGNEIKNEEKFCPKCGANQTETSNTIINNVAQTTECTNKFAWMLATIPMCVSFILGFLDLGFFSTIIVIALNCLFVILDSKELKKSGYDADKLMWFGFVFVPVYLFMRANKTDKKFAYAITWCGLFFADIIIFQIIFASVVYSIFA